MADGDGLTIGDEVLSESVGALTIGGGRSWLENGRCSLADGLSVADANSALGLFDTVDGGVRPPIHDGFGRSEFSGAWDADGIGLDTTGVSNSGTTEPFKLAESDELGASGISEELEETEELSGLSKEDATKTDGCCFGTKLFEGTGVGSSTCSALEDGSVDFLGISMLCDGDSMGCLEFFTTLDEDGDGTFDPSVLDGEETETSSEFDVVAGFDDGPRGFLASGAEDIRSSFGFFARGDGEGEGPPILALSDGLDDGCLRFALGNGVGEAVIDLPR